MDKLKFIYFSLHRNDINNMEMLSTTDTKCKWSDFSAKFPSYTHPIPITDFCHVKPVDDFYIPESFLDKFKLDVLEILPNCALAKQEARHREKVSEKL